MQTQSVFQSRLSEAGKGSLQRRQRLRERNPRPGDGRGDRGWQVSETMPSVMKAKEKKLRASQVSRRTQVSDSRGEPGRPGLWGQPSSSPQGPTAQEGSRGQGVPTAGAGVAKQEKYPKPTVAVATRPCEHPKNHRIAHSTWMNCPVSECSLSKAVEKKKREGMSHLLV